MFQVQRLLVQRFFGTNCSRGCAAEMVLTDACVAEGGGLSQSNK